MSLTSTSPIWTSCRSLEFEVKKAVVQARMLSGRYRTCWLRRHWSDHETGMCRVPGCTGDAPGTLLHLATGQCPGLAEATAAAVDHWIQYLGENSFLLPLIQEYAGADPRLPPRPIYTASSHHAGPGAWQECHRPALSPNPNLALQPPQGAPKEDRLLAVKVNYFDM